MEWDGTLVVLATPPMSGALWDDSRKRVEREVKWFAVIIPDPDHDPVSRAKVISVDAERVAEDFSVVARVGLFEQVRLASWQSTHDTVGPVMAWPVRRKP